MRAILPDSGGGDVGGWSGTTKDETEIRKGESAKKAELGGTILK